MNKRPEKKITDILHDNATPLGTLLKKVFQYNQLEPNLENYIPANIAEYVRLGNYQGGKLTLLTESGAWATKLAYLVPTLRDALRKNPEWAGLKNIEVKVSPHLKEVAPKPEKPALPPVKLSQENKDRLQQAADGLADSPENTALQTVLRRLAQDNDTEQD